MITIIQLFKLFSFAFSNISILVFGYYLLSKISKRPLGTDHSMKLKLLYGISGGIVSLILMNFSLVGKGVAIVDLRLVTVIINSYFFGGLPAFITGMMIAVGRLVLGNRTDVYMYSYLYVFISVSQLFLVPVFKRFTGTKKLSLIFLSVMIPSISTSFVLNDIYLVEKMLILFYMLLGTSVSYYLILELQKNEENFIYFEKMSKFDFLTGLPNRYSYDKMVETLFKEVDQPIVHLILLDINYFKQINDTYGHDIGDLALKLFSTKLNIEPYLKGHVYRLGGDEFAILLTDYSIEEIKEISEKIRKKITEIEIILVEGQKIDLSTSIGIGNSLKAPSPIELYKMADIELYKDKKQSHEII